MARIGATISGIERSLLNRLADANAAVAVSTLRLASGKNVNSPSDNPSAFVTLSRFQSRLTTVTATMANVTAASSMVGEVQTTTAAIRTQLDTIRSELVKDEDRTLTADQRAESQAKIDAAINQINSLATSQIEGRRLLDGSANSTFSGRNPSQVTGVTVYSMTAGSSRTLSGSVTQAATQAALVYTGAAGKATADASFTLTGNRGSVSLSVANNEDLDDVAEKINDVSHKTGVVASVNGDELTFTSVDYGSQASAGVAVTSGTFDVTGGTGGVDTGTNAVVEINGQTYDDSRVQGNRVTVTENGLTLQMEFAAGVTGTFDTITVSNSTALTFAVDPDLTHRATLALPSLQANHLGGISGTLDELYSGGAYAGLDGNTSQAIRIVDEAIGQLTRVEGSVDGFSTATLASSSQLLSDLQEDLETAIPQTDGFNEEEEDVRLAMNEALASNAVAGLAVLYQQRMAMVNMIQQIAYSGLNGQ
jgi:flagellin-like hook-associated protein FlgL